MRIKQKIFLPIFIAILLLGVIGYVMMDKTADRLRNYLHAQTVQDKQDEIFTGIAQAGQQALQISALFSRLPAVIQAFELAHSGNINDEADPQGQAAREQLRRELKPHLDGYSGMTGGEKLKLHFHLPNGRSLVRLWRDKQTLRDGEWVDISDDVSDFRHTVQDVNRSGLPLQGVELGRGGFEIRGLVPIKSADGKIIGSAEVLSEFRPVIERALVAGQEGNRRGMYLFMNAEQLEITTELRNTEKYPLIGGKYVQIHAAGNFGLEYLNLDLLERGRKEQVVENYSGSNLAIGLFPILDYKKQQIGVFAYVFETGTIEVLLRNILITLGGILGMLLFSLGFLILFLITYLVVTPLRSIVEFSEKVKAGDTQVVLDVDERDEIGQLGAAINRLVLSQRQVIRQIHQAGIQVTSSSTELAATAKQQKAMLFTQVESTKKVVKSVEDISGVADKLGDTMQHIASMSAQTAEIARQGQSDLQRMQDVMPQLEHASRSISSKLETINDKTENITNIVTTITKVADQTNLLSLNAAIEAEKAGEYGRGFTVVAREIRRLADQTAVATLDIAQMVEEMRNAVSAGVMEMDKFIQVVRHNAQDMGSISQQLGRIIAQVQTILPNFEEVNQAMRHLTERAQQINQDMGDLGEGVEQTSASLQEAFLAIEQLNEAVRGLQSEVERVKQQDGARTKHVRIQHGHNIFNDDQES